MDNLNEEQPEAPNGNPQEVEDVKITRYKEQLAGSAQEAQRYKQIALDTAIKAVGKDAGMLDDIYSKDPRLANEVAKSFGYDSYEEVQSKKVSEKTQKGFTEEDIERIVSEREVKKEHERSLAKAEKLISKLDDEQREQAQTYFDKISKGHTLDEETALEFAEMATLYVNKDKMRSDKFDDAMAVLSSTGVGKSKKHTNTEPQYVVRNGELVLLSNN